MLYFANNDYMYMQEIANPKKHKDRTLLMCEHCVEKYMKHILREQFQEVNRSQNLTYIHFRLVAVLPELKLYKNTVKALRECYYDRNYENDSYFEMPDEDFDELYQESIELIELLRRQCKVDAE